MEIENKLGTTTQKTRDDNIEKSFYTNPTEDRTRDLRECGHHENRCASHSTMEVVQSNRTQILQWIVLIAQCNHLTCDQRRVSPIPD